MSDNPLAEITEGLTKPAADVAIALIEKMADAGYIIHEPKHIVKMAKAQAEAAETQAESEIKIAKSKAEVAKIQAESKIEITDLQQRALQRWIVEQGQQQGSIENTTIKAIPQLNEDADPNAIEDDWIIKFFDKCRLVTDDKMQDLYASILAGEANRPGSYSSKTLTTLADMDQKVVSLFNTFCSLCVVNLEDPNAFLKSPSNFKIIVARVPIIRGTLNDAGTLPKHFNPDLDKSAQKSESIYKKYGFGFSEFQLLVEHGLIKDDTFSYFSHFWYNDEIWAILKHTSNSPNTTEDFQRISISGFNLSYVGIELFNIRKPNNPPEYLGDIIDFLQEYYKVKIVKVPRS